jgi:hypothetical protein
MTLSPYFAVKKTIKKKSHPFLRPGDDLRSNYYLRKKEEKNEVRLRVKYKKKRSCLPAHIIFHGKRQRIIIHHRRHIRFGV